MPHNLYMATKRQRLHRMMREAYAQINADYFGNALPRCRFYAANLESVEWQGYQSTCIDNVHRITLNIKQQWTFESVQIIMAHEMIHVLQCLAKSERTQREIHGRFFQYHHQRIFGFRYTVGAY